MNELKRWLNILQKFSEIDFLHAGTDDKFSVTGVEHAMEINRFVLY